MRGTAAVSTGLALAATFALSAPDSAWAQDNVWRIAKVTGQAWLGGDGVATIPELKGQSFQASADAEIDALTNGTYSREVMSRMKEQLDAPWKDGSDIGQWGGPGLVAQRQGEQLVRRADADAVRRQAFANAGSLIGAVIKDRIAYSDMKGDLYVKPELLRQAIWALATITAAAGGEAKRLGGQIAAARQLGKESKPSEQAKYAAVSAIEQQAGVILALASGALILAPVHED